MKITLNPYFSLSNRKFMIAVGLELNVVYIGTTYKARYVWLPRLALGTLERKGGRFEYLTITTTWGRGLDSNQRPLGYEPSHLNTDLPRYVRRLLSFDREAFNPFARTGGGSMLSQRLLALAHYIIQLFYFLSTDS